MQLYCHEILTQLKAQLNIRVEKQMRNDEIIDYKIIWSQLENYFMEEIKGPMNEKAGHYLPHYQVTMCICHLPGASPAM